MQTLLGTHWHHLPDTEALGLLETDRERLTYSMLSLGVFSNPSLFIGVVTMIISQLLFTYVPTMQRVDAHYCSG